MVKVDVERFREEGYLIIENVVPPERLESLRLSVELMVDGEKERSVASAPKTGISRGGPWYENAQPRLDLGSIRSETADVIDFCLDETVQGTSAQLLQTSSLALTTFGALCSGLIDYGFTDWHRDASSAEQAPLSGMQADLVGNAPGYVQWNIALYEDDVFWILPRSHRARTTEAQRHQLMLDPQTALDGGLPARLKPGDGIVYPNLMMHWGSQYTSRLRRTIHMGFRSFGGPIFPYIHQLEWYHDDGFLQYVSPAARVHFMRSAKCYELERDRIEAAFRAIIASDGARFVDNLRGLHPGSVGRMVCVVLLCRIANKVVRLHRPDIAGMSIAERQPLVDGSPPAYYAEDMAQRFSVTEAARLEASFAVLNRRLEEDAHRVHQYYTDVYRRLRPEAEKAPDFESRPLRTFNSEMPVGLDVDGFVASWDDC